MSVSPDQWLKAALAAALVMAPATANAAPGDSSSQPGAAQATVLQPIRIVAVDPLRFGQIARPSTIGTIVMSPLGVITATGGLLPATAIAQTGTRGPGSFTVTGDPNRAFRLILPIGSLILRSGMQIVRISSMRSNITGTPSLSAAGSFTVTVGATLLLGANQPIGTYSGTYTATVVYQ